MNPKGLEPAWLAEIAPKQNSPDKEPPTASLRGTRSGRRSVA
jgi:hypothetical protein